MTDAVIDEVKDWQVRPLEAMYPILYLDALFVSVRDGGTVIKKAVYVALGMGVDGTREVLGFWIEATESARFWLSILTDLKNRGVEDILFVCCDGLTGLPQAIEAAFPKAVVQTCIVHMIRASLRHVAWGDRKAVVATLKPIYAAETEEAAPAGTRRIRRTLARQISRYRTSVARTVGTSSSRSWRIRLRSDGRSTQRTSSSHSTPSSARCSGQRAISLPTKLSPRSCSSPFNTRKCTGSRRSSGAKRSPIFLSCSETASPPESSYTGNRTRPGRRQKPA